SFQSGNGCALVAGAVSCNVGTVAVGATGTVSFAVKLDSVFPVGDTVIDNIGAFTQSAGPGDSTNHTQTTVSAQPALGISEAIVITSDPLTTDVKSKAAPGDVIE